MSALTFGFSKNEIIRQNRTTQDKISKVKQWISSHSYPNLKDEQIVAFLVSCSNDLNLTVASIATCYKLKQSVPEIFASRMVDSEELIRMFQVVYCFPLPVRTADNVIALVLRLKDTNHRHFECRSVCKLTLMVIESIVQGYLPSGVVVLMDVDNMTLLHTTKIKTDILKVCLSYIQECMPLRLIKVFLLNCGPVSRTILNMIKPFLKKEVLKKIHFSKKGIDLELLKEVGITKKILPSNYGGDLRSFDYYQETTKTRLKELQPFFEAEVDQWINAAIN